MTQSSDGVVLPDITEAVLLVVCPSLGATRGGRFIGRAASLTHGWGILTLGNLLALLLLPLALTIFLWLRMPYFCRRYILTTRRVVVVRGLRKRIQHEIALNQFDRIDVELLPGQQWLRCGEVVFRRGESILLRLSGVPYPDVFRRSCFSAQQVILATAHAAQHQQAVAGLVR